MADPTATPQAPTPAPAGTADDPVQEFIALPQDQQMSTLQGLTPENQDKLLDQVRQRKSQATTPPPAAAVAPPTPGIMQRFQNYLDQSVNPANVDTTGMGPIEKGVLSFGRNTLAGAEFPFAHPIQFGRGIAASVTPEPGMPDSSVAGMGGPVAPLVYHTIKGLYDQARTEGIPAALGSLAGGAVGGEMLGDVASLPLRAAGNTAEAFARQITGTGERATRKLVTSTMADNDAAIAKAATANAEAQQDAAVANAKQAKEHAEKTATVQAQNDAAQAAHNQAMQEHNAAAAKADEINQAAAQDQTNRGVLARQVQQQSARMVDRVRRVRDTTKANLDQSYGDIRSALGEMRDPKTGEVIGYSPDAPVVPREDLASAVGNAKNKLKGSAESIKVFRDILAKTPPDTDEAIKYQGAKIPPGHPLYDVLKEGLPEGQPPANFGDLQGYYSELGEKLSGGNLPGDVYQAMRGLQQNIGDMMQKMASQNGVGAKFRTTQNLYRDYMQTFRENAGPNHSGSPLAQSLDAVDPTYAVKPLTNPETAARVRNMLSRFDPAVDGVGGAGQLYDNFRNTLNQYDATGKIKPVTSPEAPTAPTLKPLPKAPTPKVATPTQPDITRLGPQEVQADNAARIQARADKIMTGTSHLATALSALNTIHDLLHGNLAGAGETIAARGLYAVGQGMVGRALEDPTIMQLLSKPTPGQLEQLAKLPDAQRAVSMPELQRLIDEAKQRGVPVSPKLGAIVGAASGPQAPAVQGFVPQVATGSSTPTETRQFATQASQLPDTGENGGLGVLPDALQRIIGNAKIVQGGPATDSSGRPAIASVDNANGNTITIHDPSRMTPAVLAHEAWHLGRNNLAPAVARTLAPTPPGEQYMRAEDIYSLPAMRQKGMTMASLPDEKQAQVMQAWEQYHDNPQIRAALQPWVEEGQQMLAQQSNILPTPANATGLVTTPRAPVPPVSAFAPR